MPRDPEHSFALRQVYRARTGFSTIESNLEIIHQQLARQPARRNLSRQ
jgi:hypothetical protein